MADIPFNSKLASGGLLTVKRYNNSVVVVYHSPESESLRTFAFQVDPPHHHVQDIALLIETAVTDGYRRGRADTKKELSDEQPSRSVTV